jgi:nitroimidazol reductase NimA-like FMN-containing flavoprotein (pyridoxamine 5'-phosphate oxidase superfamily)
MTDTAELRDLLVGLLSGQRLAVLATHRDGQPYSNLVAFTATDDLRHVIFATTRATRKYANISADSRVALLIDNRSNEDVDFHRAVAVTATGTADELQGESRRDYANLYLAKHPHMEEFVGAPTCALLKVRVERYYVVRRFQNVMELDPWL